MTISEGTTRIAWLPAVAGTGLCMGAIGLLCADAFSSGHVTITHGLQPLLVLGTVAAAVLAHRAGWRRPISALMFLLLATFGSAATIFATLGRQADTRDVKVGTALAENRTLTLKSEELDTARATAKRECANGAGQKCANASARVDALVTSMASLRTVSPDPRADAIADLAYLVASADKVRTRAIVAAIDPLVLPLFLELGSILFFAVAFPHRRRETVTLSQVLPEVSKQGFTKDSALADFRSMKASGPQSFLADRWQVSEGTVSKWMAAWESDGAVARKRDGRTKVAQLAGPVTRSRVLAYKSGPAFN